jgi:hypothetical protein
MVYAKTRLEVGPEVDLTDPAVSHTGPWRDVMDHSQTFDADVPVLRLF